MALTAKQERYARFVAGGEDLHSSALKAGCKNYESARKFVSDMAKRENVQAFIKQLQAVNQGLSEQDTPNTANPDQTADTPTPCHAKEVQYESPLDFLVAVFNNSDALYTPKERISAAIALLPYTEQKLAQTGKKEDAIDTAKTKSENGRFATLSNQTDMFISDIKS